MGRWVTINGHHVWMGDGDGDDYEQTPEDMRRTRIDQVESQYRYHATTPQALVGIYKQGLKPSKRGYSGPGVYLSDSEEKSLTWTEETTGGKKLLRVSKDYLRDNTDYDEIDDTQGKTTKKIPTKYLEVKNLTGEWEPLSSYAKKHWRSFGISKY